MKIEKEIEIIANTLVNYGIKPEKEKLIEALYEGIQNVRAEQWKEWTRETT